MFNPWFLRHLCASVCMAAILVSSDLCMAEPLGGEFQVNTADQSVYEQARVAMSPSGAFVAVWYTYAQDGDMYGVFAQRYDADGLPAGGEFQVNTYTTNHQCQPGVAMDAGGNFVIVWTSIGQDGNAESIYGQRYDADGTPLGLEFPVNAYAPGTQWQPSVAMAADGRFIVAWADVNRDGIYARRFAADGDPQGGEFKVSQNLSPSQGYPTVSASASGRFAIAWDLMGSSLDVYARLYDEDGVAATDEFRVNTYTASSQARPDIAMDDSGDFVIVWQSLYQDGDWKGVYARRYDANGGPRGDEFCVSTVTKDGQEYPRVAMNADGDFVVAWCSQVEDATRTDVFGRYFSRTGRALCDDFRINTTLYMYQDFPDVAADATGDFVVIWSGVSPFNGRHAALGRRFTREPPLPVGWWPLVMLLPAAALVWQYRRNQHRVVERMQQTYSGREADDITLIPAYVNLDCVHNYPVVSAPSNAHASTTSVRQNNGVHPAEQGCRQIGDSLYCWMLAALAGNHE